MCVCVGVCVCACACVRACVRVCEREKERALIMSTDIYSGYISNRKFLTAEFDA